MIPTAENMFKGVHPSKVLNYKNIQDNLHMRGADHIDKASVIDLMTAFAKLHVKAALEAVAKEPKLVIISPGEKDLVADKYAYNLHEKVSDQKVKREVIVDKESILNAYPLTNIK